MAKFPVDAPKRRVIKTLEILGFRIVREREHISMVREKPDGTQVPLTLPNHPRIKGSTLRTICTQAGIPRSEFLDAFKETQGVYLLPIFPANSAPVVRLPAHGDDVHSAHVLSARHAELMAVAAAGHTIILVACPFLNRC
jgi:predicted RNA binding protein YcfA (HicA-like mRNA interferase family)